MSSARRIAIGTDIYRRAGDFVRQDSARDKARRYPGRTANQVRSHHQSHHRESARRHHPPAATGPRRRGDRMMGRGFTTLFWLLIVLQPTSAWAEEDHVVTAHTTASSRADACTSSSGKAFNLCTIQGWFNVKRIN